MNTAALLVFIATTSVASGAMPVLRPAATEATPVPWPATRTENGFWGNQHGAVARQEPSEPMPSMTLLPVARANSVCAARMPVSMK